MKIKEIKIKGLSDNKNEIKEGSVIWVKGVIRFIDERHVLFEGANPISSLFHDEVYGECEIKIENNNN
jgi:hypothetical protein